MGVGEGTHAVSTATSGATPKQGTHTHAHAGIALTDCDGVDDDDGAAAGAADAGPRLALPLAGVADGPGEEAEAGAPPRASSPFIKPARTAPDRPGQL